MPQDFVNPFGSFLEGFRLGEDDELEKQEALRRQRALDLDFLLNSTERDFQRETVQTAFSNDLARLGVQHGNNVDITTLRHGQGLETIGVQNDNATARDNAQHGRTLERDDLQHRRTIDRDGATSDRQRTDALIEGILNGSITGPAADQLLQEQYGISTSDLAIPVYDENGNLVSVEPLPSRTAQTGRPTPDGADPRNTGAPQPRAFEEETWQNVYEQLQTDHGLTPEDAFTAVERARTQQSNTSRADVRTVPVDRQDQVLPRTATSELDVFNYYVEQLRAAGVSSGELNTQARALTREYMSSLRTGSNMR